MRGCGSQRLKGHNPGVRREWRVKLWRMILKMRFKNISHAFCPVSPFIVPVSLISVTMEDVFLFCIPDLSSKLETIKEMKEWSWKSKGEGWGREKMTSKRK